MSTYHVVSIDIITHVVSDSACSSCPRKEVWQKYCAKAPSEFKINQITSAEIRKKKKLEIKKNKINNEKKYCAKAPSEFKINQITSAHSDLGWR